MSVSAQSTDKLTSYLNGSNAGTEFYLSFPPCFENLPAGDSSVRIFIASEVKQEVLVEVTGKNYSVKRFTEPNGVIEIRFTTEVALPYKADISKRAPPEYVYKGNAIHVKSQHPIIVYGRLQFYANSGGFLAIPVSSFGTEYVIASYPEWQPAGSSYITPSVTNIIAAYNDTKVTFLMGGDSTSFGSVTSGGLRKGKQTSIIMNKGDVWCFANSSFYGDISGSLVTSDKPIGIVSGNQCANIPTGVSDCDYICEMELPTYTWGKVYHVPFSVGRLKAPIIRVFAKEPNTKVYKDGKFWFDISLSSRELGKSFVEKRLFEGSVQTLLNSGASPSKVISADKPIYVMLYNPGRDDGSSPTSNDPFEMVISSFEQFRKDIFFSIPRILNGFLSPSHKMFVDIVYQTNADGTIPDDLEFGICTSTSGDYSLNKVKTQFGSSPGFKFIVPNFTHIVPPDIVGKNYAVKRIEIPLVWGSGLFRIKSDNPLAAYFLGKEQLNEYAYPASLSLYDLETNDTIKPKPYWTLQCDGSVRGKDGNNNAIIDDSPNSFSPSSKLGLIYMDTDSSFNYKFEVDSTFIPGLSTATEWTLKVVNPKYDAKARLVFIDRNGNDTIITLRYSPTIYDLTQNNNVLQLVKIGETQSAYIELTNRNLRSPLIISDITLKSGKRGFILPNRIYPLTIEPGKSTLIEISFTGSALGRFRDTLIVHTGCGIKEKAINEAFVGEAYISSTDLDFGLVDIGQKEIQNLIIKNTGNHQLKITGINGPYLGQNFKLVNWPNITSQNPILLSPNETRQFTVEFTPTEQINYADSITLNSNADGVDSISVFKGSGKNVSSLVNTNDYYLDYSLIQSHNILSINFNPANFNPIDISLFDILGNNRYSQRLNLSDKNTNHSIYLDSFTSGIYILSIKQGNKLKIEKILVK